MGFADAPTADFAETREKVYESFFGSCSNVSHEAIPYVPHIDVLTYEAGAAGRDFCTIVTSGMSDVPMAFPATAGAPPQRTRAELIFYCAEPRPEYIKTIRWLARFPHDNRTWISWGHTIPNGDPAGPFWGSRVLDTVLFLPTIVRPDSWLSSELQFGDDPVEFLWVVPLTTAECNWKLAKGFDALLDLFQRRRHPHVFDPNRASYV